MHGRIVVAILAMAWIVRPCQADGPRSRPVPADRWRALFADGDAAGLDKRIDAVLEAVGPDAKAVKALITADSAYEPLKPGQDVIEAGRAYCDRMLFKLDADLDRGANALDIRASGVAAVRVYVLEGMFDLSRPVTIRLGRRAWTGRIAASPRCILTHYAPTRDAALICNEIDLDQSGAGGVQFKDGG